MVMGHSLAQWTKWYDLDYHDREAQQAVDAMEAWRGNLLSSHAQAPPPSTLVPPSQPQHQVSTLPAASASTPQLLDSPQVDDEEVDDVSDEYFPCGGDGDDEDEDFLIDIEDS